MYLYSYLSRSASVCLCIYYTHTEALTTDTPFLADWGGVKMFSPVQQECSIQVSHIYNMPALCLKLNLGTGSTETFRLFQKSEFLSTISIRSLLAESRYKLAINSQ